MTEKEQLAKVLARVRKLIALAEHESTPDAEAQLAREQADALMLKFTIDEAMVDAARPAEERGKPTVITVEMASGDMLGYVGMLIGRIARHCRCKARLYTSFDHQNNQYNAKVYGFTADLRYFQILYTTVRLHMLGILRPGQTERDSNATGNLPADLGRPERRT